MPSTFMHVFFSHFFVTLKDRIFHFGVPNKNRLNDKWTLNERRTLCERTVSALWKVSSNGAEGRLQVNAQKNGKAERFRDCTCNLTSLKAWSDWPLLNILFFRSGFPGSQPVSMDIHNLNFLKQKPYKVSWKADGTRLVIHVHEPEMTF